MRLINLRKNANDKAEVYILGTPEHGNLGNQCIAQTELKYIQDILPGIDIHEVTLNQYLKEREILVRKIKDSDLLLLHGGGNIGNLWPRNEDLREDILQTFPNNYKIIFPQSTCYTDDEEARMELERAKSLYCGEHILMVCRDQATYEFAQKNFTCPSILTPDMVMYNAEVLRERPAKREGILFIRRKDKEKWIADDQWDNLEELVKSLGLICRTTDTVREPVNTAKRDDALQQIFHEIASAELVITDRLHGMIFSAITGTPCIALDNSYHKISGGYTWLKNLKYIYQSSHPENIDAVLIQELLRHTHNIYPKYRMRKYFRPLSDYILSCLPPENTVLGYSSAMKELIAHKDEDKDLRCIVPNRSGRKPLVSVIIPVYNVSAYLSECIESVLHQTMQDFEIICVNDGSTDSSPEILREWSAKDPRISVYTQKNAGLSRSRNSGIQQAKGKYLYYLDSDDRIRQDALEKATAYMQAGNLDVLFFGGTSFADHEEGCQESLRRYQCFYERNDDYPDIYSGPELMVRLLDNEEYRTQCCMQMVSIEHFMKNKLWFEPGILHEDNPYTFECLLTASRAGCLHETLYQRRIHANSIMTSKVSYKNVYGYFISSLRMSEFLQGIHSSLTEEQEDAACELIRRVVGNAKNAYLQLSSEEQQFYLGMNKQDQLMFDLQIRQPISSYAKLEQVYREKSEINAKLQQTYKEKSEINAKLQQTYKEKSEINAKLQQTYKEKAERGILIKELKAQLAKKK